MAITQVTILQDDTDPERNLLDRKNNKNRKKRFDQTEKSLFNLFDGTQDYAVVESGSVQPINAHEVEEAIKTLQDIAGVNDILQHRVDSLRNRISQHEQRNILLLEEEDDLLLF